MKQTTPRVDSSVHSLLSRLTSHAAKLAQPGRINNSRVVVLVVLVGVMAVVSFTTSSASSWGGLLRARAVSPSAATPNAGSPRRVAPAIKKQGQAAPKQGKDVVGGTAELNVARKGHTATSLFDRRIIIVGGENASGPVQESEVYDPESRTFSISAKLSTARAGHTATKLDDGRILIVGGHDSNGSLKSSELFDPAVNQFSRGPVLAKRRSGHTATRLADGRILVAGGDSGGTAEIFDVSTMRFTRVSGRLATPRSSHSAILLKSGRVLIAGGVSADGEELRSGEVFDPASSQFTSTRNSMFAARTRPTLHELPDGKVQVIGGDDERSIEMFNTEGQYFTARARLVSESDSETNIAEVLRSSGRAALIDNRSSLITREKSSGLRALRSPVLDDLLARGDALTDLLDRSEHTITEIPGRGSALITGGRSSRGMTLMSSTTTSSSAATVTTDKTDYQPGDIVHMSGTNWQPGETVQLTVHRDNGAADVILTATVEADGTFQNSDLLILDSDYGVTFLLSALGLSSGYSAQTTFTDAANINSFASDCSTATETFTSGTTVCAKATGLPGGGGGSSGRIEWWAPGAGSATRTTPFSGVAGNFTDSFAPTICGTWTLKVYVGTILDDDDTFVVTSCGTAPTFTACPSTITQNTDPGVCTAAVAFTVSANGSPTPTISCVASGATTGPVSSGSTFNKGTTSVVCTATNGVSPDATCSFTVTINDNENPGITCPSAVSVNNDPNQCSAIVNYSNPSVSDNCPGVGTPSCDPPSGSAFSVGTTTVTCNVSDDNGNSNSCSFIVTVKDSEAPTCNLPANITQNNDPGACGAAVTYSASATDNCPGATIVCNPPSGDTFAVGTTTVNCTASDTSPDSPNTTCSFTVTVKDVEAPTCNLPANPILNNAPGQCGATVTYTASANDNCGAATILCSPASGSTFPVGVTTVSCVASDSSPDSPNTNCGFTVTVIDVEAPTCNLPGPIVTSCASSGGSVVEYVATASDNCPGATISCTPPSGSTFPIGNTTVNCTAQDASPDSPNTECSFTVSVQYTFNGFFQPVDNPPSYNLVKAGQSVPLKFQLTCGGSFISDLSAVANIQSIQLVCDGGADGDPIPADDSGASGLHYDYVANQFIFSWKTDKSWANKCRKFILTLADGTVHCAYFKFKK